MVAIPRMKERGTTSEGLRAKILEAIDEGLRTVLGESCSRAIYYYFQTRTGLRIEDAVDRPEALASFLRGMFMAGAQVLERKIVERLCAKLQLDPREVSASDLATLVRALLSEK